MPPSRALRRGVLGALLLSLLIPGASAHAWLLEARPAPNEHVTTPPDVLFIRFTEDVERQYTRAEVFDANGTRVDAGQVIFDDQHHNQILVPLQEFGDGVYTVRWYSLSVDTHTAQGRYLFAVGNASLQGAADPTAGHVHEGGVPMWLESVGRTVFYAAVALALGAPIFLLYVVRGAEVPARRLYLFLLVAAGLGAAAAVIVLYSFTRRIDLALADVASSRVGILLLLRLLFPAGSAAFVALLVFKRWTPRPTRVLLIATSLFAILAFAATSLSSHAAALSDRRGFALAADAVHLLAGGVWIGGVASFFTLVHGQPRETLAIWIRRFSPLAMTSVGLIVLTGVFASWLHLRTFSDLWSGQYGWMILLKVSLLGPLVLLGAYNRFIAYAKLAGGLAWQSFKLQRALILETLLMVGVLVAAGVLATSAPPGVQAGGSQQTELKYEKELRTAHLVFMISPYPVRVGVHNYTVQLHSFQGGNPQGTEVFLKFLAPGQASSEGIHTMNRQSADEWTLSGGFLAQRGTWTVQVTVQRPDEYAEVPFQVNVA